MTIPLETESHAPLPSLRTLGGHPRLFVDGRPFLVLGGELHNSSSGSRQEIRTSFATLAGRNFNTILAPVTWETVEPREGDYDFSLVDELLASARDSGVRLVPLWFGAWKNGKSTYTPAWVKTDPARFPRAELSSDAPRDQVSPFGEAIREADARAFAALMRYLRTVDATTRTVIMVQVENEVGLLGDSRDRSAGATRHFDAEVPDGVYEALDAHPDLRIAGAWKEGGCQRQGNWAAVFGDSATTDEAFMATAYATHIEAVAAAGKAEYPLPMFTNAWLDSEIEMSDVPLAGGQRPGTYPSGGPLPHVAGLWRQFAPTLDLVVPDIYFGGFADICRSYRAAAGALFIPEMRRDEQGAGDVFLAIGSYGAIGTSPFGIDSVQGQEGDAFSDAYGLLESVAPLVANHETVGVHVDETRPHAEIHLGDYVLSVRRETGAGSSRPVARGYGIVIQVEPDQFIAAGRGLHLTFRRADGGHAELLRTEEIAGRAPDFQTLRVLNGDETVGGTGIVLHSLSPLPPSSFPIPTDRRGVGLVRCRLHPLPRLTY
ncbi:DUF5597 domain-containing protein [Kribbella sp. NPDC026611]|uniref:GH35 family beta-galactosidase n=1 Tax=Kribbella sp. NPDC026611 TaxID=3154911 RepID=UPI0033D2F584